MSTLICLLFEQNSIDKLHFSIEIKRRGKKIDFILCMPFTSFETEIESMRWEETLDEQFLLVP